MQTFRRPKRRQLAIAACIAGSIIVPSIAVAANASGTITGKVTMHSPTEHYGSGQFEVKNDTAAAKSYALEFEVQNGTFVNHSEWNMNATVDGARVVLTPKNPLAAGQTDYIGFGIEGDGAAGKTTGVASCDLDGATVDGCEPGNGGEEPGDTEAPTAPQDLTAHRNTSKGDDVVHVMWAKSADNVGVTGYEIERDGKHLQNHEPGDGGMANMLDIAGHEAGERYEYRVRAYDAAGNKSAWSDTSTVQIPAAGPDTEAPVVEVPATIAFDAITSTSAVADWKPATDNVGVDHYETTTFGPTGKTTKNVTEPRLSMTSLEAATTHSLVVVAVDAAGNRSVASYSGDVTTERDEPGQPSDGVPSDFAAKAGTYNDGEATMHRVEMTWTPDAAASGRYEVFLDGKRAQTLLVVNAGDYSQKPTDAQTRYLDLGTDITNHRVKLRAQLSDGSWSAFTPEITVK